jgi:hypothetical protein
MSFSPLSDARPGELLAAVTGAPLPMLWVDERTAARGGTLILAGDPILVLSPGCGSDGDYVLALVSGQVGYVLLSKLRRLP